MAPSPEGVLERLLEEPGLAVSRISGTSAGALNGAALATGYAHHGGDGARAQLALLWQHIAMAGLRLAMLLPPERKPCLGLWDDEMPLASPYVANPMGLASLRVILDAAVGIEALRSRTALQFSVNAVSVSSGLGRVFGPADISVDALLARPSLP